MLVDRRMGQYQVEFYGSKRRLRNPADWIVASHKRAAMQSETTETAIAELIAAQGCCKIGEKDPDDCKDNMKY